MSQRDYAHWNEDSYYMWWQEEGRFDGAPEFCDLCGFPHSGECDDDDE